MRLRKFLRLVVLSILAGREARSGSTVEVLRGTEANHLGTVTSGRLRNPGLFREVHLRITVPDGNQLNCELLIIYDTVSKVFWWTLSQTGGARLSLDSARWFGTHSAIYATENKVVAFWGPSPGSLYVVERKGLTAYSADEAQATIIQYIQVHAVDIAERRAWLGLGGTEVLLGGSRIPLSFWLAPLQVAAVQRTTKIVSVVRDGLKWRLILRDQWDQEVVLDDSYHFVSTRRLDMPAATDKQGLAAPAEKP
jgi:hypothetical protein